MAIKKKICLLGAFSAGKTSLVRRFVESTFSDKYITTVGVKVDKKQVAVDGQDISLLIWDIHGEDNVQDVPAAYLRGAAGYFIVADGTRRETLSIAYNIQKRMERIHGDLPFIVLLNKTDLAEQWDVDELTLAALDGKGWQVIRTSAKTGEGVEGAFTTLTTELVTER